MQVNEILNKAATLLGENLTAEGSPTDERTARLVNALGVAYMRLITEYAPLEEEESITVSNGSFELSALTKRFFDVVKLVRSGGGKAKCKVRGGSLFAEDGSYSLRYCYTPNSYPALGGTIEMPPRVSPDLFASGVAAEYALESMLFEEATLFEKRYKEGLANVLSSRREITLPFGRWL